MTIKAKKLLQGQIFCQRMLENLINDLLDLAKLENNSFNISNDYFNLKDLIFESFEMLSHLAEKH